MAAPSKSFTAIVDSDLDPDSPLTTGLMTALRDNDENFNSQLIGETTPFVAAQKHDHDGANSKKVTGIDAAAIKTALFNLSTAGTTAVSTGALGFDPVVIWVVGIVSDAGDIRAFNGFATGTGTAARSIAWGDSGAVNEELSIDADAVGGKANLSSVDSLSHAIDLDITAFAAANITFTPASGISAWTFKVLVLGA